MKDILMAAVFGFGVGVFFALPTHPPQSKPVQEVYTQDSHGNLKPMKAK